MRDDEQLDERIDAALRSYAEPADASAPRVAVAQIFARAREERARRIRLWTWVAFPACALLIAALVGAWMQRSPRIPRMASIAKAPHMAPAPAHPANAAPFAAEIRHLPPGHRARMAKASAPRTAKLPKLDVFPTPRPLSPQEQALVAFVQRVPAGVRQAVIDDQQNWDKPIITTEARMGPLADDDNHNQKSNPER